MLATPCSPTFEDQYMPHCPPVRYDSSPFLISTQGFGRADGPPEVSPPPSNPPGHRDEPGMRDHAMVRADAPGGHRSEEHTSELQSRRDLVCRLLLEKKKKSAKRARAVPRPQPTPKTTN